MLASLGNSVAKALLAAQPVLRPTFLLHSFPPMYNSFSWVVITITDSVRLTVFSTWSTRNDKSFGDGPIPELCAKSFPVMKASLLITDQGKVTNGYSNPSDSGTLSSSSSELRGVGSIEDRTYNGSSLNGANQPKSAKENKPEDSLKKNRGTHEPSSFRPSFSPLDSGLAWPHSPTSSVPTPQVPSFAPIMLMTPIPTNDNSNEFQTTLSRPAILTSATIALLLLVFGLLKVAGCRHRRERKAASGGPSDKNDHALSGDASVSSEPSQLLQLSPQVDVSSDESDPALPKKRRFLNTFLGRTVAKHDPLQQTRVKSIYAWKDAPPKHSPLASEIDRSSSGEVDSRGGATPKMYHLNVFAVEDNVSSSISSDSLPNRFKSPIDLLFRRRGTLFGRGKPIKVSQDDELMSRNLQDGQDEVLYRSRETKKESSPISSPITSSRELRHENEILEIHGAVDYSNDKPWRNKSSGAVETPRNDHTRNDPIEIIDEFLSAEIVQKFRDVDKMLTDGLQQFNDEDDKLATEVEKLQAYMDNHDASNIRFVDSIQETSRYEDCRSRPTKQKSSMDTKHPPFSLDCNAMDDQPIEDEAEHAMLKNIASQNEAYDSEDGIGDDNNSVDDDRDMQEHFAPTWSHRRNAEAWKASRSALCLPRNKYFEDSESQQSSLLPPRVDSLD